MSAADPHQQPYAQPQPSVHPQQAYGQQQQPYGQQPYAQPQQTYAQPQYAQPQQPASGNVGVTLATVSLIAGVLTVVVSTVYAFSLPLLYRSVDIFTIISVVQFVQAVLGAILGLIAVVTGVIALVRRSNRGRARAGAGVALGGATLISVIAGMVSTVPSYF